MKKYIALIFVLMAFPIASPVWGAAESIYVAQTARGSDTGENAANAHSVTWLNNAGNWDTNVDTANGKVGPGDTVCLSGNITSRITIQGSGTSGHPITVTNVVGEDIVIRTDASTANNNWTGPDGNGIYTKSLDATGFYANGLPLRRASDTTLSEGAGTWRSSSGTMYYKPIGAITSQTLTYLDGGWPVPTACGFVITNKSYLTFTKNTTGTFTISNVADGFMSWNTVNQDGIIIDGINFQYCLNCIQGCTSVTGYHTQGIIRNCTAINSTAFIRIYSWDPNPVINTYQQWDVYNNVVTNMNLIDTSTIMDWEDREFVGLMHAKNCNIYNNTINNGYIKFIYFFNYTNGETSGNNVYNNFIYHNNETVFYVGGNMPAIYNNNKFYNNISVNVIDTGTGDYKKYNVIITGPVTTGSYNNYYYNNTIVGGQVGVMINGSGPVYSTIKNNLFVNQGWEFIYTFSPTDYVLDYNGYYSTNAGTHWQYQDGAHTWTDWKVHEDAHGFNSNPNFVNAGGTTAADYKLQSNSPAWGKGTYLAAVTTDYFGNPRFNTATGTSIGAVNAVDVTRNTGN